MNYEAQGFTELTAASVDSEGRSWIEVIPAVEKDRNGIQYFTINDADLQTYADSIRSSANRIAIDRDHETDHGRSSRAAGWFTGQAEVISSGGVNRDGETQDHASVWAEVKWTPSAVQEIRDGEFRFISPVATFKTRDKKTGLMTKAAAIIRATLTNKPHFKQLAPVMAEDLLDSSELDALKERFGSDVSSLIVSCLQAGESDVQDLARSVIRAETSSPTDTTTKESTVPELKDTLIAAYKLDEDADDETILAAVKAAADENAKLKAEAEKPKIDDETIKSLTASAAKGEQAARELHDMRRDSLLAEAVREGKILPVSKDAYASMYDVDAENVKTLLDSIPARSFKAIGTGAEGEGELEIEVKSVKIQGTDYPVDGDSAKLDAAARKILAEKGKDKFTDEDYLAAVEQAQAQA